MIYLDYAATAPMTDVALKAYTEVAKKYYGNSASLHDAGGQANYYVEAARRDIAETLGVSTDGIVFTGGGTEGNLLAIVTLAKSAPKGRHIITYQAEHTSVHAAMNVLQQQGYEVTRLPLLATGDIDIVQLRAAIRPDTALISLQHVNSEIGAIFPIAEVAALAKETGTLLHVDCVQSFCKLPIAAFAADVDAITVSAHKIGGPKGCGAVYINPRLTVRSITPGVTHERGLRGGTLDTPAIVAFAAAVEHAVYDQEHCDALRAFLSSNLPKAFRLIESKNQLPTICSLFSEQYEGQYVLLKLNDAGIYISTGSACDIRNESGTKAVMAMGYSMSDARKFFRISFSSETTIAEMEQLVKVLNSL